LAGIVAVKVPCLSLYLPVTSAALRVSPPVTLTSATWPLSTAVANSVKLIFCSFWPTLRLARCQRATAAAISTTQVMICLVVELTCSKLLL